MYEDIVYKTNLYYFTDKVGFLVESKNSFGEVLTLEILVSSFPEFDYHSDAKSTAIAASKNTTYKNVPYDSPVVDLKNVKRIGDVISSYTSILIKGKKHILQFDRKRYEKDAKKATTTVTLNLFEGFLDDASESKVRQYLIDQRFNEKIRHLTGNTSKTFEVLTKPIEKPDTLQTPQQQQQPQYASKELMSPAHLLENKQELDKKFTMLEAIVRIQHSFRQWLFR